jgi:hypothetical protein
MAVLITGILFFSCAPAGNDAYGTLVISLPGGGSEPRAAVSGAFAASLSYRIECNGPGERETWQVRSGAAISVQLIEGDWTVTVTALNAADQNIGSGAVPAFIESGKLTTVQVPLSIDTSGNDLTRFAITSPVSIEGTISGNTIAIQVPFGTNITAMDFSVVHTGVSISPAPGAPLDFSSPQTFTVRAENPQTPAKSYVVTVTAAPPSGGGTGTWPATWQNYGLAGLTQPGGTTVQTAIESAGAIMVYLESANLAAFNALVAEIESGIGSTGTASTALGLSEYELSYSHAGVNYTLTMIHDANGLALAPGTLMLAIEPGAPSGSTQWPDNSRWDDFGLSGLTQPAGTTVADVTDAGSPYEMLSVTLNQVTNAAYDDLLGQITTRLGSPFLSNPGDGTRVDQFSVTAGTNSLMVTLSLDTAYDEIIVSAIFY